MSKDLFLNCYECPMILLVRFSLFFFHDTFNYSLNVNQDTNLSLENTLKKHYLLNILILNITMILKDVWRSTISTMKKDNSPFAGLPSTLNAKDWYESPWRIALKAEKSPLLLLILMDDKFDWMWAKKRASFIPPTPVQTWIMSLHRRVSFPPKWAARAEERILNIYHLC